VTKEELNREQMYLQILFEKNAQIIQLREENEKLLKELSEITDKDAGNV